MLTLLQSLLVWQGWTPHGNRDTRIHTSARKGQIMNRNLLGWLTLCLCLFLGITFAHATPAEYTEVKTLSLQRHLHTTLDWHVTAYVDTRAKEWDPDFGSGSGRPRHRSSVSGMTGLKKVRCATRSLIQAVGDSMKLRIFR